MVETVYIRMRNRVEAKQGAAIMLSHIAQIIADEKYLPALKNIEVHRLKLADNQLAVLDIMDVIRKITMRFPTLDVQTIGPTETIIEMIKDKKTVSLPLFSLVWLLLFIGSGLAILNFHEEVSMQAVHQKLHLMITGEEKAQPLLLQISYSIGIGLGMVLFFNHIFKKRFNDEPSPLEIEIFNYQQDLDHYVTNHENKENVKHLDRD